jgi:hypothetical protein
MVRSLARVSALVALALPGAVVAAQPAGAAVLQSCAHVSGSATFTPGLTNTPRNNVVKAKGTQTSCTPVATTGGSAGLTATINVPAGSCAKLAQGAQTLNATARSNWKNGKFSVYKLTIKTGTGANATLANIAGTVTQGIFLNRHISGQIRFKVTGAYNCTTQPVKTVTFTNTKPFVLSS